MRGISHVIVKQMKLSDTTDPNPNRRNENITKQGNNNHDTPILWS